MDTWMQWLLLVVLPLVLFAVVWAWADLTKAEKKALRDQITSTKTESYQEKDSSPRQLTVTLTGTFMTQALVITNQSDDEARKETEDLFLKTMQDRQIVIKDIRSACQPFDANLHG